MNLLFLLLSLIIAILPIYLIGNYFYKKDTIKEPKQLLRKLFFSGIVSGIIVIIVSLFSVLIFPVFSEAEKIENPVILFFYCYIFVALVEELFKFIMIYYFSYNNENFDQAYDIVLYSIFVGLGFACFENIIYAFGSNISFSTLLLRGLTAIPAHTSFQILMGYYLYLSKKSNKIKYITISILIPVLFHGTYDYFIFSQNIVLLFLFLGLLIFIFCFAYSKVKKVLLIDKTNLFIYCPKCGNKINYNFCPKCGYKKQ